MKEFFVLLLAMTIMASAATLATVHPSSAVGIAPITLAQVGERHTRPPYYSAALTPARSC